jgi:methionyl-tRNA formyltransferase
VAEAAATSGLTLLTPATLRSESALADLRDLDAELIVLADYGRLIPASVLELPSFGALNLHPSLLPRHRGAAPIPAVILAGDSRTGVTLMRMDAGLDTGPIVAQRTVALDGSETSPELEAFLAHLAAELLAESLPAWLAGAVTAQPQSEDGASLTHPLHRADGRLDPSIPARQLERQVRAYQPWPGSWTEWHGVRLIVWRASAVESEPGTAAAPGELVTAADGLVLATSVGGLRLDEIQPAGGRRMSAAEYLRGRRD